MKVAQFSNFGNPGQVIECIELPDLNDPKEDEVLIDVLACPINPADLNDSLEKIESFYKTHRSSKKNPKKQKKYSF